MSIDGGRAALGGFLYQIIGVLGLKVWAEIGSDDVCDLENISKLLKIVQEGTLHHEELDSDALIRSFEPGQENGCSLVQFKYSALTKSPTISYSELKKIANQMKASATRAQKLGHRVIKYFLITNRRISPTAVSLLQTMRDSSSTNSKNRVLRELEVISELPKQDFEGRLVKYGQSFGLSKSEVTYGINQLVGELIGTTASGTNQQLTVKDIIKSFTGTDRAVPLTAESLRSLTQKNIELQVSEWVPNEWDKLIYRSFLKQVQERASERALVIICGEGGCGKTSILGQWAYEKVKESSEPNSAFTYLIKSPLMKSNCIIEAIRKWSNLPITFFSGSTEDALERLRNANPGTPHPIFHLGLDGIDEEIKDEYQDHIRDILYWFKEKDKSAQYEGVPPIATLIITCRKKEFVYELLRIGDGFSYDENSLPIVEVGDFSDNELLDAARESLPDLHPKIAESLQANDTQSLGSQFSSAFGPGFEYSADLQVITALRHPIIWRFFLELGQERAARALKGEDEALAKMSRGFIQWCAEKIRYRLRLSKKHIQDMLRRIAQGCESQEGPPYTKNNFTNSAENTGLVNVYLAADLYSEALVSGLIREDANSRWRWRHEFVWKYLLNEVPSLSGGGDER